jgi:hypothetical protein
MALDFQELISSFDTCPSTDFMPIHPAGMMCRVRNHVGRVKVSRFITAYPTPFHGKNAIMAPA